MSTQMSVMTTMIMNGTFTGSITPFGIEQKANIIVTRVKIKITFYVVQNVIQIYNLVRKLAYCLPFVKIFLITKPYHYFNSCYNKISLLFDLKWCYALCDCQQMSIIQPNLSLKTFIIVILLTTRSTVAPS